MVSPAGSRTGVQITRESRYHRRLSSRVHVHLTFTNISDRPIRWSIWDVVQLRAEPDWPDGRLTYEPGCVVTAPVNPRPVFRGLQRHVRRGRQPTVAG